MFSASGPGPVIRVRLALRASRLRLPPAFVSRRLILLLPAAMLTTCSQRYIIFVRTQLDSYPAQSLLACIALIKIGVGRQ